MSKFVPSRNGENVLFSMEDEILWKDEYELLKNIDNFEITINTSTIDDKLIPKEMSYNYYKKMQIEYSIKNTKSWTSYGNRRLKIWN